MVNFAMIQPDDLERFKDEILEGVKKLLVDHNKATTKKTRQEKSNDEIDDYVILQEGLKKLGISYPTWWRKHKHFIKWKQDGKKILIYLPSIVEHLKKDNIND